MKEKRVVFMGTPEFSVPVLENLIKNTNVVLVVTMPDKKVGRKQILTPTPVKQVALKNNIEVFTPEKIKNDYKRIKEVKPDIIITCAYGGLLPKELLEVPKYGSINVHASLLPKYRGASPINSVIINGETETGITIMYMDEYMDTGDIISQEKIEIFPTDNARNIHDKLSVLGSELLLLTLPSIFNGTNKRIKQEDEKAIYCYPIKKEDEKLNFNINAENVINKIRGMNPFPGCYFILNGKRIKITEAKIGENTNQKSGIINIIDNKMFISCKDKEIELIKIKPEGKSVMLVKDYINGIKKEELIGVEVNV